MSDPKRRDVLLFAPAGLLALLGAHRAAAADAGPETWPFRVAGGPVKIEVRSTPVRWRDYDYHLVRLGEVTFSRNSQGRLTGAMRGSVVTFDKVEYEVHVALLDGAGRLLGTARTPCPVQRVWLGKVLTQPVELAFDFGVSKAYDRARSFTVAITERDVLTPDQWEKGM